MPGDIITITRERLTEHGVIKAHIQSNATSWECYAGKTTDIFVEQMERLRAQLDAFEKEEVNLCHRLRIS